MLSTNLSACLTSAGCSSLAILSRSAGAVVLPRAPPDCTRYRPGYSSGNAAPIRVDLAEPDLCCGIAAAGERQEYLPGTGKSPRRPRSPPGRAIPASWAMPADQAVAPSRLPAAVQPVRGCRHHGRRVVPGGGTGLRRASSSFAAGFRAARRQHRGALLLLETLFFHFALAVPRAVPVPAGASCRFPVSAAPRDACAPARPGASCLPPACAPRRAPALLLELLLRFRENLLGLAARESSRRKRRSRLRQRRRPLSPTRIAPGRPAPPARGREPRRRPDRRRRRRRGHGRRICPLRRARRHRRRRARRAEVVHQLLAPF